MTTTRSSTYRRTAIGIGFGVAVVGAIAVVLLLGENSDIFLSFAAIMAAITLGVHANRVATNQVRETQEQVTEARRATSYAFQPLLVPVHVPRARDDKRADSFPAMEGGGVDQPSREFKLFRVRDIAVVRGDKPTEVKVAELDVKNVGQGPAIVKQIELWSLEGSHAQLIGPTYIGSGTAESYSGAQHDEADKIADVASYICDRWGVEPDMLRPYSLYPPERVFFLEVTYDDIFERRAERTLKAVFNPEGRGVWQLLNDPLPWQR